MTTEDFRDQEDMLKTLPSHLYDYIDYVGEYVKEYKDLIKATPELGKEFFTAHDEFVNEASNVLSAIDKLHGKVRGMFRIINKLK